MTLGVNPPFKPNRKTCMWPVQRDAGYNTFQHSTGPLHQFNQRHFLAFSCFQPPPVQPGFLLLLGISAEELSPFCQCLFKIALQLHLQATDYCCALLVSFCFCDKDRIIKTLLKQQQYYKNLKIQAPLSLICTNVFVNENRFQNNSAHLHLIAG